MGLSYVIEYLLTLERPGRGRLVYGGVSLLLIPAFPPGVTITFTTAPYGDDYAYIPYYNALGPAMVPGAFYGWAQQWGNKQYEGTVSSWFMANALHAYVPVTQSEPAIAQITNQSPLNQLYEGISFFIGIATEDDYNLVLEALARLGTSARLEQLGREATELLRMLTGGPPEPRPPLGGE